jgi:site-specific recombinase XerD
MAFIETRKYVKKTTYRVHFNLEIDGKKEIRKLWFDDLNDAEDFLLTAKTIENKSKSQTAPPQEVDLWVSQGYLDQDVAARAFPIYAANLKVENKGHQSIDWGLIEEEYSDTKLDLSGDKDELSEGHQHKMRLFRRVKAWIREEHSNLQLTRRDIEAHLRSMRQQGRKAQTRKHWLITFNLIADTAVRLGMMRENPAKDVTDTKDKITVSVPSRPKHIKRVLLPRHIAQAMLNWTGNAENEELQYERKERRKPHILLSVNIEQLKELPEVLHRSDVMDALNISYASVKRYVSQGILPKPSQDPIGRKRWSMKRQDLINYVASVHESQLAKTRMVRLKPEQTTMRGCFPLAFRLGLWAGLRNGEAVWLPWDHVHIDERRLYIGQVISPLGRAWSPKSDIDNEETGTKERWLGMNPDLCNYFIKERERQEAAEIKTFFVFPSGRVNGAIEHGKPLGARVLNDAFQKHLQWVGFPKQDKLTFYSLRHTFCTELLRAGTSIEDVRDRMGHTDIRTTQTYLHPQDASSNIEDVLLKTFASDEDPQQTQ